MLLKRYLVVLLASLTLALPTTGCDEASDIINPPGLTDAEVIAGLKEALTIGTDSTVQQVNALDGYFGNALIKIQMPDYAQNAINVVGNLPGGQALIDNVVLKMNRAAEAAAQEAKPIFWEAITDITIADGWNILRGADTAATSYLRVNTEDPLYTAYKPKVEAAMTQVGVQQAWSQLTDLYNTVPLVEPVPTDISDWVTSRALRGLFVVVGQKEAQIRNDVTMRVTDLLRRVFAQQ
jgi:uncharacterized protein (DUF736 family)